MSAAAMKWAMAQQLPQTEKAVLMALARVYSPRWGYSMPSQSTVAEQIGVSRETVNRAIGRLIEKRLISKGTTPRKKGQWDRRYYHLNPLDGGIKSPAKKPSRVTQDHTAPCDFHQTRHRVTQDHTSRIVNTANAGEKNVLPMRGSGGAA